MIAGLIAAPIAFALVLMLLIGQLSESFASWSAAYVNPFELFGAFIFVLALAFLLGPVIESAEAGLTFIDWVQGGMR